MKTIYLIQGSAQNLAAFPIDDRSCVYALCYDKPANVSYADEVIFDPNCTWAEGRNILANHAVGKHPDFDYLLHCDDDVRFTNGSFADFEELLAAERPLMATPLVDKAVKHGAVSSGSTAQAATVIDQQCIAIRRDLLGVEGIQPLVSDYDEISWLVSCLIFEYLALTQLPDRVTQFNTVRVLNEGHTGETGGTHYNSGRPRETYRAFRAYLDDQGISYDPYVLPHVEERIQPRLKRLFKQAESKWFGTGSK